MLLRFHKGLAAWLPIFPMRPVSLHLLAAGCPVLLTLARHTLARLQATAAPLLAPQADWAIRRQLGCSCGDCRTAQVHTLGSSAAGKRSWVPRH